MNNLYFDPFSLRRRMIFSFLTHFPRATLDWMIGKLFKCHGALGVINHERKRCSGILNRTNRQIFCHSDMKLHLEDFQRVGKTSDRQSFLALARIFNSHDGSSYCWQWSDSVSDYMSLVLWQLGLSLPGSTHHWSRPQTPSVPGQKVPSPNALPVLSTPVSVQRPPRPTFNRPVQPPMTAGQPLMKTTCIFFFRMSYVSSAQKMIMGDYVSEIWQRKKDFERANKWKL